VPSISLKDVAAGTANCLDGLLFQSLPEPGALVTIYASTPTDGNTLDFSVGSERFLSSAETNVESSANVVDTNRDMVLDREPCPPGKMFLAVNTQIGNVLLVVEALPLG